MPDVERVDVEKASQEHFARIHRAALVLTGNAWDADDLAQETFLVLARNPAGFKGQSSLYTWLYGVLLNLERHRIRRNDLRRRGLKVLWDLEPLVGRTVPTPDASIEAEEWKKSLWAFVAKLPQGQRQALVLRFSEHLRYDEIAVVLDCPLGTVKSRIFHGLASLRAMLAEESFDPLNLPSPLGDGVSHAI